MLILRRSEHVAGRHCARCLAQNFFTMQGLNMIFGWWGTISFVLTVWYSLSNVFHFAVGVVELGAAAVTSKAAERAAGRARESVDAEAELARFQHTIRARLSRGEAQATIAADMVDAAGVPLRKAEAYVAHLAQELG
jgi:hypothetical protein